MCWGTGPAEIAVAPPVLPLCILYMNKDSTFDSQGGERACWWCWATANQAGPGRTRVPSSWHLSICRVGQNPIYTVYIRYFWQQNIKYTVIYGEHVRFWPTLCI